MKAFFVNPPPDGAPTIVAQLVAWLSMELEHFAHAKAVTNWPDCVIVECTDGRLYQIDVRRLGRDEPGGKG